MPTVATLHHDDADPDPYSILMRIRIGLYLDATFHIDADPDPVAHQSDATTVPEFIDPVFSKTSPKRSFSLIEN